MRKSFKKIDLVVSACIACAGWGGAIPVHAQEAPNAPGSPQRSVGASDTSPATPETLEEVVVTGSAIRGAPPVGSNLITLDRSMIEDTGVQSTQQILKLVPAITGMGSAGQGAYGTIDAANGYAPSIHGLGGVSSNSTLVLIDGHRLPLSGIIRNLPNPNILPPEAIERVEVLPDGASSVYGSDAVAGVINFVTRKGFDGLQVNAQGGLGDQYHTGQAGLLAGKTWDAGWAQVIYDYSYRGDLTVADRPFALANHLPKGGTNYASFACGPATIQPAGGTQIYTYPYTGAPFSNAQRNAPCDYSRYNDLLPVDARHSLMVKIEQQLQDNLVASLDVLYSSDKNVATVARGSVTAQIFGPGSANTTQISPFFQAPAGSTATSETVRFDPTNLVGPGAQTVAGEDTLFAFGRLEYRLGQDWSITGSTLIGRDRSFADTSGTVCTSCALLALNGTVNQTGNLTAAAVPGTKISVTNVPLTAANALDPFNLAGSNRTSAAVLASLTDGFSAQEAIQTIQQFTLKADGTLFTLPGGKMKLAAGGEYVKYNDNPQSTTPLNTGVTGAQFLSFDYSRDVKSAFAEVLTPILNPEMGVPFARNVQLSVSGRYDDYSDFGSTTNPKFALNWDINDSVKVRGNIAHSFVAPPLATVGERGASIDANYGSPLFGPFQVPLSGYPQARLIPACATAVTTCLVNTAAIPGIAINGANPALQPSTGRSWSLGLDFLPASFSDFAAHATYWHNDFRGAVTAPQPSLALNSTGYASLLTLYPTGATPQQVAAFVGNRPASSVLPNPIYFTYDFRNQNALNLTVEGIDADIHYLPKFRWGSISAGVAGTYKTRFDQQVGSGSPVFSVLNTVGFNSTFPSERLDLRGDLGLHVSKFHAIAYINYTGSYWNWSSPINPIILSSSNIPVGGGDHISSNTTVDTHFSYDFGLGRAGLQVFLDATNVFNRYPPFLNRYGFLGYGYDPLLASPIGRVVTLGVRMNL